MTQNKLDGQITTRRVPLVASQNKARPAAGKPFLLQVITQWTDIGTFPLFLQFRWNKEGFLASIATKLVYSNAQPRRQEILNNPGSDKKLTEDTVCINPGHWISAMDLVMETRDGVCGPIGITLYLLPEGVVHAGVQDGDKRMFEVGPGFVFTGFKGEATDDAVTRLGLVEGMPAATVQSLSLYTAQSPRTHGSLLKNLWADQCPPKSLLASEMDLGYWCYDVSLNDTKAVCALVFGTTKAELAAIKGISGDALLGGFSVHYTDRDSRMMGPRQRAMKYYTIAGNKGERVIGMTTSVAHLPQMIMLKTNWDRQLLFGSDRSDGTATTPVQIPANGNSFCGFYCSWWYAMNDEKQLTSCAMLSGPTDDVVDQGSAHGKDWLHDQQDRYWDNTVAPLDVLVSGPVYGNNQEQLEVDIGGNNVMTTNPRIAAWLDFGSPLDGVEVWFTHPLSTRPSLARLRQEPRPDNPGPQVADVQFLSIILHRSDGTRSSVGPQEFDDMYRHHEKHEPSCVCKVMYEGSTGRSSGKKLPFKLHYHGEEWQVSDMKIAKLRVWSSVFLEGLQFVAEDGTESPCFGHCYGEATGAIRFGGNQAVSLSILDHLLV